MPRILIVDDQATVRAALAAALRANRFDVAVAEDVPSALTMFEAERFDVAIIDVYMPRVDGVQLIKALRVRSPGLPIVAISGMLLNNSERTALDFLPRLPGLSEIVCLQKPFRPAALLRAIDTALTMAA